MKRLWPDMAKSSEKISRRQFLAGATCALMAFSFSGCSQKSSRSLNIYNYSNYIAENTIADFKKATGISVIYDEFSSQDVLFARLKLGDAYDLVVATDYMLRRLIHQHILYPIDGFTRKKEISERFQAPPWDPELRWSVPYLWGTTGIGYNASKVYEKPLSWDALWDKRYAQRITMLDEKRDSIGAALIKLGYSGNSENPQELAEAKRLLYKQKHLVRQYTCDYIDSLARNEVWLAQAWSGDVARARASNPNIDYCLPQEGSFMFVDSWCIPKFSKNRAEAAEFLNFCMQPQVVAQITNHTGFPNTIENSKLYVNKELLDNPLGYPPMEMLDRTVFQTDIGAKEQEWDKIWGQIKFHNQEDKP